MEIKMYRLRWKSWSSSRWR